MGLEKVRKDILEQTGKRKLEISKKEELRKKAKVLLHMADSFYERKNYTSAFYTYFRALKLYCLLYINKKMGNVELSEMDALEFVGKKERFGLNQKAIKEFLNSVDMILARKYMSKKRCYKIKKILKKIKKEA